MFDKKKKDEEPKEAIFASNIQRRKVALAQYLADPMGQLARSAVKFWPEQKQLDARFERAFKQFREFDLCNQLYAMDVDGIQISSVVTKEGIDSSSIGKNRSYRPYMIHAVPSEGMILSPLYINSTEQLTSITAVQLVETKYGKKLGYIAAEFTLLSLPMDEDNIEDRNIWIQAKGDPSIRGTLFQQSRTNSVMDQKMDDVIHVAREMMIRRGVFHLKLHFSSSRATMWLYNDPYRYRVHVIDEFLHAPLAYPKKSFPNDAVVNPDEIRRVFDQFRALRNADDTIYLRAGGINIINGMVSLNFSCDGSHYMPAKEFISKGNDFWMGSAGLEAD